MLEQAIGGGVQMSGVPSGGERVACLESGGTLLAAPQPYVGRPDVTSSRKRIDTPRLSLEPLGEAHAEALYALYQDPAVSRFLFTKPNSREEFGEIHRCALAFGDSHGMWALLPRGERTLIGRVGFFAYGAAARPDSPSFSRPLHGAGAIQRRHVVRCWITRSASNPGRRWWRSCGPRTLQRSVSFRSSASRSKPRHGSTVKMQFSSRPTAIGSMQATQQTLPSTRAGDSRVKRTDGDAHAEETRPGSTEFCFRMPFSWSGCS